MKVIHEVGTRKRAVARATLTPGTGMVRINSQLIDAFSKDLFKEKIMEPIIIAAETPKKVDINVIVRGGGKNSQADAARLAIAKTLAAYDKSLKKEFGDYDRTLEVADVRQKESAKPNRQGKARAKVQKSYR